MSTNAASSLAARLRHGYRTTRGYVRGLVVGVLEVTGIAALGRKIAATRTGRVALAIWRFAWGRIPRWLRRCLALCLAIPGPLDELAAAAVAVVFVLVPLVVSAGARSELAGSVRGAWNGETQAENA